MSDYGHHPNEIRPTLQALRNRYPQKKLIVVFQPHQYSRTRELLDEFRESFLGVDILFVPNIYFSRDKEEDVTYMTTKRFCDAIWLPDGEVIVGNELSDAARWICEYDMMYPNTAMILLLGAGDIDTLRTEIPLQTQR